MKKAVGRLLGSWGYALSPSHGSRFQATPNQNKSLPGVCKGLATNEYKNLDVSLQNACLHMVTKCSDSKM